MTTGSSKEKLELCVSFATFNLNLSHGAALLGGPGLEDTEEEIWRELGEQQIQCCSAPPR
jgi:tartrate dehydratase beta subunit/fumarate hydratase class I family protein